MVIIIVIKRLIVNGLVNKQNSNISAFGFLEKREWRRVIAIGLCVCVTKNVVHASRVNVKSHCSQPPTCMHALFYHLLYPSKYYSISSCLSTDMTLLLDL